MKLIENDDVDDPFVFKDSYFGVTMQTADLFNLLLSVSKFNNLKAGQLLKVLAPILQNVSGAKPILNICMILMNKEKEKLFVYLPVIVKLVLIQGNNLVRSQQEGNLERGIKPLDIHQEGVMKDIFGSDELLDGIVIWMKGIMKFLEK